MLRRSFPRTILPFLLLVVFSGNDWTSRVVDTSRNEHLVMSVLWFQRSAEFRALCYQAFSLARMRLDVNALQDKGSKRRAVVVDIDETVLDNSPHMGKLIAENKVFPYAWTDWVNRAEAEPIPGSVEFLKYAVSRGYDVFYVSNRSAKMELLGTMKNLESRGFPQVSHDHVLLKEGESSKEARRQTILKTHEIVLLIGDNLNDMAKVFERKSSEDRAREVDRAREQFGDRYVVIPNPMYGEWESAVYKFQRGLTDEEKDNLRKAALKSF